MSVLCENVFVLEGELLTTSTDKRAVKNQMIGETKLVLCSVLALVIGIASVTPLAFIMSEDRLPIVNEFEPNLGIVEQSPQNFSLDYVYIGDYWNNNSRIDDGNYGWKYTFFYTTKPAYDLWDNGFDAALQYYAIEVTSEHGLIANMSICQATSIDRANNIYRSLNPNVINFTVYRADWNKQFTGNETLWSGGAMGSASDGTSKGQKTGSGTSLWVKSENWDLTFGKPESLNVTVRPLGWVLLSNTTTIAHIASSEPMVQVQLEPYGDGFIHNNMFTPQELTEMNPVMPQFYKRIW